MEEPGMAPALTVVGLLLGILSRRRGGGLLLAGVLCLATACGLLRAPADRVSPPRFEKGAASCPCRFRSGSVKRWAVSRDR